MKNNNNQFNSIAYLMNRDGSLEEEIFNLQCELKRDTTIEEENSIIQNMLEECQERCTELSCSIEEAYQDIMY